MIKKFIQHFFFSVGRQILALLALLMILFFCFVFFNHRTLKFFTNTYSEQTLLQDSIQELKKKILAGDSSFEEFLKTGNRENLADFNKTVTEALESISTISAQFESNDGIYLLRSIETGYFFYFNECCKAAFIFSSANSVQSSFGYYEVYNYANSVLVYLIKYCDELQEISIKENLATYKKMKHIEKALDVFNFIFVALLLIFYSSFLFYVSRRLTRPLTQLVNFSRNVSDGDFSQRVPELNTANSVGVLTHAFNKMCEDLQAMMDSLKEKVKTEEKLLREQRKNLEYKELLNQATFLALQTQTNPHFLFNTLNSIGRTITLGKTDQSLEMIDSLANLLRYNLSDAEVPVALNTELEIAEEYIRIQQMRFGDRIRFEKRVEKDIEFSIKLPKFTLQPLVENAIIHGLEPKEEGGKIIISARKLKKHVVIRIFDDGTGIQKEVLKQILDKKYISKKGRIGVINTKKRLELFEKSSGNIFSVASRVGKWTMISIRLKVKKNV